MGDHTTAPTTRRGLRAATALVVAALVTVTAACSSSGAPKSKPTGASTASGSSSAANGPLATFTHLTGTAATVKLTPAFESKLAALHVVEQPEGRTTLDAATNTLSFPITGGSATFYAKGAQASAVQGKIDLVGSGLTLTAAGTKVTLSNPVLDPSAKGGLSAAVLVNGQSLGASVTLFEFDTSAVAPTVNGKVATVTGIPVYVAASAAVALNAVLQLTGSNALPTAEHAIEVGTATITAQGS